MLGLLAFSLVAGGATSAFAKNGGDDDNGKKRNGWDKKEKERDDDDESSITIEVNGQKIELTFHDVEAESAWALQYIAELVKRGVFTGYEDGSFRPNQKVTRIEAIVAAVRQMGLRAQAESAAEMSTDLQFKDAEKIEKKYPWAVGYVAVALEKDLFLETESEVKPEQPADRLWSTILLVKALGLEKEAKAKMNTKLEFKDSDKIPAGAVGYVAVALEKGLVTGYENNTFRPNQPVTRAELAAILDRTGDHLPDEDEQDGQFSGTFSGIANGKLTLTRSGQSVSYSVDDDVSVVRNNKLVDLDDLETGDKITVLVVNNVVIHITVTDAVDVTDGRKTGTVTAVASNKITIANDDGTKQYTVDDDAVIVREDEVADLDDVELGDKVTAVISGGVVVQLTVTDAVEESEQASGTVTAVADGKLTLSIDGDTERYTVDDDAIVLRNNVIGDLDDIRIGDRVTIVAANDVVVYIAVTRAVSEDAQVSGVVTEVGDDEISLTVNGRVVEYDVDDDATIVRNGEAVELEAVQPGDKVSVVASGGVILSVTVTDAVSDNDDNSYTVEGKYASHRTENGKVVQISITTLVDGKPVARIYNVAEDADIEGNALTLEKGVTDIELTVRNQIVTEIEIK